MKVHRPITVSSVASSTIAEPDTTIGEESWSAAKSYATTDIVISTTTHKRYQSTVGYAFVGTPTISTASPAVLTISATDRDAGGFLTGWPADTMIVFTGTVPTGLSANTIYYMIPVTPMTYNLAATAGGAAINASGGSSSISTTRTGGNLNRALTDTTWWTEVSPTNRWMALDKVVSTRSYRASSIQYVFAPGVVVASVALFGLTGSSATLKVLNASNVQQGATQTANLDSTTLGGSWTDSLFSAADNIREAVLVAPATGSTYKQQVDINIAAGTAYAGEVIPCSEIYSIGTLEYGVESGFTSYSTVAENSVTGYREFVPRAGAKYVRGTLFLTNTEAGRVFRLLSDLDSIPCVWEGVTDSRFAAPLTVYGFIKGFTMVPIGPSHTRCNFEIKGLI